MRRFAAAGTRQDLTNCARLLAMAPGPEHIKPLMAGFEAAFAGRALTGLPTELAEALAKYSGQSLTLGLRQGKPEALSKPFTCWPTIGPTAPSSSSSFRSWARCAGRLASRLCSGSPASRPTTPCGRPLSKPSPTTTTRLFRMK